MDGVFVSYRRDDVGPLAAVLQPRFEDELDAPVFFDLQSIPPGEDWEAAINAALQRCSVFVLLLGRDWVGKLPGGKRRIDEDDDVFRLEIERALDSTAIIIPVLVGGVAVPEAPELPEGLRRITNLQTVKINPEHIESSINTLIIAIRSGLDKAHDLDLEDKAKFGDALERRRTILNWSVDPPDMSTRLLPRESTISMSAQLMLAADSALATGRPLLLVGATDKARRQVGDDIARRTNWRYYEIYCTERTTIQDFIYTFDQTRRLHDAQMMDRLLEESTYIEPGVLWWAFDAVSARSRGAPLDQVPERPATDPNSVTNAVRGRRAVVAIHNLNRLGALEIEDLFRVLDDLSFFVTELGVVINAVQDSPQIILGVERIRWIPKWVRQQCAVGRLQEPSLDALARSARLRVGEKDRVLVDQVVEALNIDLAIATRFSTIDAATFEDLLRAVLELGIEPGSPAWRVLLDIFSVQ
jgi:hypothetical protein